MDSQLSLIVLLCAVVVIGRAEFIKDPTLCGRTKCKVPAERKFKYAENISYQYRYAVDVSTNLGRQAVNSRNESTLHIDAAVIVQFTSPCEGYMKFSNASISHDRRSEYADHPGVEFKSSLEEFVLRFAFDDGQVHELCPNTREPPWTLNLKRGVLSMLQNTMRRFDVDHRVNELDVNGICDTSYKLFEAKRTSLIIKKTKDLTTCTFGAKHLSIVQSAPYKSARSNSKQRSQPLVKSETECEIAIDHNVYQRVVCKEVHRLQPLSNGNEAGARTESTATLELVEEVMDSYDSLAENDDDDDDYDYGTPRLGRKIASNKRTNLLYDHGKMSNAMHGELRTARELLKGMCELGANSDELQQRFSEKFTMFVHSARLLDYPSLSQLFRRANTICKNGRKRIITALPFMGSNAAVNVTKDLIMEGYVNEKTVETWVTIFALIPRPDPETIRILAPLLDFQHQIPDVQFILSYSAVIHAYCSTNQAHCAHFEEVIRFLSHLEQKIRRGCMPRAQSLPIVKETLEALKAIGNMGLETETLLDTLRMCVDDVGGFLPMEVKVAAVEAHRRLPSCEQTRDQFFLDYYRNVTLDTEIRIASYMQMMRCPDYNVIKIIKGALKDEEVNQVGSFVWSHLTNLYNSASPTRVEVQSLLTDKDLGSKFNKDMRKFSRNYDGSFFSEEYNFGANYQSNLIFSPKSYVPRSASFNVTADLFGESVNLFEVTARMEGLEYYAENLFGPEGPYSNEKVTNKFKSFLRSFRAAPEKEDYWDGIKRLPSVIDNNFNNPKISLSYKIFGNEVKYTMFNGDEDIRAALTNLNPWENIKKLLSGQEIYYENSVMFLDTSYVVPMTSGLPVRLDLAGSAACHFKMSGSVKLEQKPNFAFQIFGNIMPSVSIDAVGSMTVDAFYKSAGVKLRTNVYSSGALTLRLDIQDWHLARLSLLLPNRENEVFSVSTDVLWTTSNGAKVREEALDVLVVGKTPPRTKLIGANNVVSNRTCSWAALDRLIGLKLCTDYQFPNVTQNPNASYFLLNGPTLFKVSLIKADPSAKSYLLEYTWDRTDEHSILKLIFNTPGSEKNRELSAMVAFDVKTQNVTVLLQSSGNSVIAKGTYKRTENETLIDIAFDVNGTNHLEATVGYTRTKFTYGYTYHPKFQLTINNERIAAMSGTVRNTLKDDVSQCDIDLVFQTKKVWSKLIGYIVKRNISLGADFQLNYQLQKMPKNETLHLEVLLANRSSKTLTHKSAVLKLHSTAYPHLNTVITAWYQQALGHLELHAEVNSSPHLKDDRHKLTAQLVIAYSNLYFQNQGTKVHILFAITKPIQNLDIKIGINHYSGGAESRTSLIIGYAPGKEISLAVNTVIPRGLLFAVEGHANLTIPNFNSMIVDVRITERVKRKYELDFAGTWFSGYNMTAQGTYVDASTPALVSNSLKLILKSPSFANDIHVNYKFLHDHKEFEIAIYVDQGDTDKYAFVVSHALISPTKLTTYLEGRYKNNVYFIMTNVDTEREIRIELHLDKWRDVHLTLTGINEDDKKEFGVELKWDANRDPTQKFVTLLRLNKIDVPALEDQPTEKSLVAMLTVSYPGRLVTGKCLLTKRGDYNYKMDTMVEWSPEKMIRLFVEGDYTVEPSMKYFRLESQLLTPFLLWRKTAFDARYSQVQNEILASSSMYWRDTEYIVADLYTNAEEHEEKSEWIINCGLSSTVNAIGYVTTNITHKLFRSRSADTQLLIKYHPDKVINARSIWHLDKASDIVFNLTGNIQLETPLANYNKADMKCQLRVLPDWKFDGAASLDLNKRKYAATLFGDLFHLTESKVEFNATTPLVKYAFVRGRFGLSENKRHIVAQITTPAGPLGFEAICQLFTSLHHFNVKLLLATPIDVLQRALLVARLDSQEADFRLAYNNITAGFQGVWRYHNITDFFYSYTLYTPLAGLHESSVVTKLIVLYAEPEHRLDVDTEFTVRVVDTKVGIKAKGGPKPPPIRIPIKTRIQDDGDGNDDEDEDDEDNSYWNGEFALNLAIIEPVIGELDIDTEGEYTKVLGSLVLPNGKIVLNNIFWMEDVFHIKNELSIDTPFSFANEISAVNVFTVDVDEGTYMTEIDVNVRQNVTWLKSGISCHYNYHKSELDDSKRHNIKLNIKTPLPFLRYIDTQTIVDLDDNFYKVNVTIRGENCTADLIGSMEVEEGFMDTVLSAKVDSEVLKISKTKIITRRDFTDKEKYLKISFVVEEPTVKSTTFEAKWNIENENNINAALSLDTWLESLRNVGARLAYSNQIVENGTAKLNVHLKHYPEQEYKLNGKLEDSVITADLYTPIKTKEHLQFRGNLIKINESLYTVRGELRNPNSSEMYHVSSNIITLNNVLSTMNMTILPRLEGSHFQRVLLRLKREKYGITISWENYMFNTTLGLNYINALNWDVRGEAEKRKRLDSDKKDKYELSTFMNVQVNGNTSLYVHAQTPWEDIKSLTMDGNMFLTNNSGDVRVNHRLNRDYYHVRFQWKLLYLIDMFGKIVGGYQFDNIDEKHISTDVFFRNPTRGFRNVATGFDIDIDHERWKFASNVTVGYRNYENVDAVISVRLPPPDNDDHRFLVSYHANKGMQDISYVVGYSALRAKSNYASDGSLRMATRDIDGHFRLTWGMLPSESLNNLFNMTFDKKEIELKYSLYTPNFLHEETVVFLFNYDGTSELRYLMNADVFYPASKRVGTAKVSYTSLQNVNGTVNATTTLPNFPYGGCNFVVVTTLQENKRFIEFFWPNNTAILNSDYSYHSERLDSDLDGVLHVEVPLNTRHISHLTYGYKKRPQLTTGHALLTYNKQEIVNGQYDSKSESKAGFEKDTIQVTVENIYKPIGITYVNQYEYSGGNEGTNYPTTEFKQVNVYHLTNSSLFNIAAESRIRTTHTGQNIQLKAVNFNRTVQMKTDYQVLPGEFDHNTWLSLTDDVWISYHVNILNKTTEEVDNQFLVVGLAYPARNFTLNGSYKISSGELNSDAKLEWDADKEKPRNIGAAFEWRNISSGQALAQQHAIFSLRHPSFVKEVTLKGEILRRDVRDLMNAAITVDYSTDPDKLFVLSMLLRDESNLPKDRKYIYSIIGKHPRTQLDLVVEGYVRKYKSNLIETRNRGKYKRSFLPEEAGKFNAHLDVDRREALFDRENNEIVKYLRFNYYGSNSQYVLNGSVINTPELNATGTFFFDPRDKFTWMMVNYTPDAVESLRMYGKIPNARNAVFDVWRTYDRDLSVSDISFYLKLNHSRLVTSTLRWRPELRKDIIDIIRTTFAELYNTAQKDADYWKQYIKSETVSVISDVWDDAQEDLTEFLDDWNNLRELEGDMENFKRYLNDSYNANDFYIKDIVGIAIYVIDELSLRRHIESLPNIVNEIWEIMGDSGQAIRESLLWIIEAIKSAYEKVSEIVTAVVRGDSVSQVANIIEKLIEKYDMFIKDLHVSFIKYIENLWNKISMSISQQWHKFLKLVEPLFIRVLHYLEAALWKASKEIADFLYDRRNEIITSPYFDRFTNLTQDIDRFYRDIKANDIITNIHKYSGLIIQFLKERYFAFVPFGNELKDVIEEIILELKELQKLPSVHYALEKMQQVYDRANYLFEYFEIRARIESVIRLAHAKLVDISQTALEAESRYREAKTMFIFDPNRGLMCLEQKLPMSWHAFNQTPEFQEIPEYRAIVDIRSYFVTSNTTFWNLYYRYKPYTEPSNWLPPFKAQAMITGAQHYKTFDGRYFDFAGNCTYLMAHDFVRNTFSILVNYYQESDEPRHRIIVLIDDKAIELDVFKDTVQFLSKHSSTQANILQLPVEMENGTTYVYQEESVIIVERKNNQFRLECNLKFDLCTLELSGWYYGKTAGLFGTMNNEPMDDVVASNGIVTTNLENSPHIWATNDQDCYSSANLASTVKQTEGPVYEFCEELFVNKSSEFSSCFAVIDPKEYYEICLLSLNESVTCTAAMAYMQVCMFHDTYLRIPDRCTTCAMIDGAHVAEGEFRKLEGSSVPRSGDVVFVVEAKECNRGIRQNRSIEQLVTQLNKEFREQGLIDNRWSLVAFGGNGVLDRPRSIILNGQTFTKNIVRFIEYFDHIQIGEGSQDVFAAIGFASQLVYRAGVSKTLILMPCSHCEPQSQTLDYSVLHQVLLEHDITLHILMDGDFEFEKERLNKIFYGLDATKSYTKKDTRALTGDVDLRRQVKLSKSALGYCTPLSLETNGTIFTANKLRFDKLASIKKFVSVFSKRVALTAIPSQCQHCECTADNHGVTQMECMRCVYPTPVSVDYDSFNFNESLSALQPLGQIDYGQIDIDDD